jgi:hypothetical protein
MPDEPSSPVNPVLLLIVVGLGALFVAALLYQILGSR